MVVAVRRGNPTAGDRKEGIHMHPCGNVEMVSPEHSCLG